MKKILNMAFSKDCNESWFNCIYISTVMNLYFNCNESWYKRVNGLAICASLAGCNYFKTMAKRERVCCKTRNTDGSGDTANE